MNLPEGFPRSPVSLPEGKVGRFELKHSYEDNFEVVTMREAIHTGKAPIHVQLEAPIRIHSLYENGGLWIADIPVEVRQHQEALVRMRPRGRVLVGGLGLGIMAGLLARCDEVEHVDVVEISPEVAQLCDPKNPKVQVHVEDFRAFLARQETWQWSGAFVDTWTATSEGAWWEDVFPIRRLIGQKFGKWYGGSVEYWAEDIMLGQVAHRLMSPTRPHWYYQEGLRMPMTLRRARWFVQNVGTPLWEKRYGVLYPEGGAWTVEGIRKGAKRTPAPTLSKRSPGGDDSAPRAEDRTG